jgi:hypothetical protein
MANKSFSRLLVRKTLGTYILLGTIGLVCLQTLYYVSFGPT